jgi:hypothetical protein
MWTLKRWQTGGGAHEEPHTIVWVDNWDDKKILKIESRQGLRRSPIDEDTHNNQPEIDGHGGGDTGEEV